MLILKTNLPFADEEILEYVVDFLQKAHEMEERYSVRDGINIARYALKRLVERGERLTTEGRKKRVAAYLLEAATLILDPTAVQYFKKTMEDDDD